MKDPDLDGVPALFARSLASRFGSRALEVARTQLRLARPDCNAAEVWASIIERLAEDAVHGVDQAGRV